MHEDESGGTHTQFKKGPGSKEGGRYSCRETASTRLFEDSRHFRVFLTRDHSNETQHDSFGTGRSRKKGDGDQVNVEKKRQYTWNLVEIETACAVLCSGVVCRVCLCLPRASPKIN